MNLTFFGNPLILIFLFGCSFGRNDEFDFIDFFDRPVIEPQMSNACEEENLLQNTKNDGQCVDLLAILHNLLIDGSLGKEGALGVLRRIKRQAIMQSTSLKPFAVSMGLGLGKLAVGNLTKRNHSSSSSDGISNSNSSSSENDDPHNDGLRLLAINITLPKINKNATHTRNHSSSSSDGISNSNSSSDSRSQRDDWKPTPQRSDRDAAMEILDAIESPSIPKIIDTTKKNSTRFHSSSSSDGISNSNSSSSEPQFDVPTVDEEPIFLNDNKSKIDSKSTIPKIDNHGKSNGSIWRPETDESLIWEISSVLAHLSSVANFSMSDLITPDKHGVYKLEGLITRLFRVAMKIRENATGNASKGNSSKKFDPIDSNQFPLAEQRKALVSLVNSVKKTSAMENNFLTDKNDNPSNATAKPTVAPGRVVGSVSSRFGQQNVKPALQINQLSPAKAASDNSQNLSAEDYLKQRLLERAPHFLAKEDPAWKKAEKRREQICILLSSVDTLRQKCCLSLKLACPEFGDKAKNDRFISKIKEDAIPDRFEKIEVSSQRKNAFIADTLSRISNFLSMLINGEAK